MLKKLRKKILFSIVFAVVLYLGFTIYADFGQVVQSFKTFNWLLLPLLLLLSLANYYIRFLKWDYYLNLLKVTIKKSESLIIFMSGLIMSVTPGKMGELLKSFLVKEISGTPVSRTAPVVFIERITDFLSLIILTLIGAFIFDSGIVITVSAGVFFLILVLIISNRKMAMAVISLFERINFFKKHLSSIHNAYESSYILLRPVPLFNMIALSIAGWFFECFGYHLILINFDIEVSLLWASFIYAFATIIGSLTMLPGGLGATEGSLTVFVIDKGFPKEAAVASTFVVRVVTLWFAVLVGILSVMIYQKQFGKIDLDNISNQQNGDLNAEV